MGTAPQGSTRARNGQISRQVYRELQAAGSPLWPAEIRRRIEQRTGQAIVPSSVKEALARGLSRGAMTKTDDGYELT